MEEVKSKNSLLCKTVVESCEDNLNITYDSVTEITMNNVVDDYSDLILPDGKFIYLKMYFSYTAFLKCTIKFKINSIIHTSHFLITKFNEKKNRMFIFEPANSNNILCSSNNNNDEQRNENSDEDLDNCQHSDADPTNASASAKKEKYKLCAETIMHCHEKKPKPNNSLISMKSI